MNERRLNAISKLNQAIGLLAESEDLFSQIALPNEKETDTSFQSAIYSAIALRDSLRHERKPYSQYGILRESGADWDWERDECGNVILISDRCEAIRWAKICADGPNPRMVGEPAPKFTAHAFLELEGI